MAAGPEVDGLIQMLARLPGLGPRSARRAALHLLQRREAVMLPLARALERAAAAARTCAVCGNLGEQDLCAICADPARDIGLVVVVAQVGDLWALERARAHRGRYHVLGGVLSALDGIGPEQLAIDPLAARITAGEAREVVLALSATVDGQTTAHYVADRLAGLGATVSRLAQGAPLGAELDQLDEGTLAAALAARR